MARITKIGLWLIPWFPISVLAAIVLGQFYPWYETSSHIEVHPDGSASTLHHLALPLPLVLHWQLIGTLMLVALAAFLVGCAALIIVLVRTLSVKQPL
jgi:hypothetical protein